MTMEPTEEQRKAWGWLPEYKPPAPVVVQPQEEEWDALGAIWMLVKLIFIVVGYIGVFISIGLFLVNMSHLGFEMLMVGLALLWVWKMMRD